MNPRLVLGTAAGTLLFVLLTLPASAQRRSDPLTNDEINQLRDTAVEPELRMKLFVQFARARLVDLEQMRANPKTTERAYETRKMLEDFLAIYNELDDNLDNFEKRRDDLRKALRAVLEGDTDFQSRLRALKDSASAKPDELKEYELLLSEAIDTVDSSTEDHRQLLAEQTEYWKKHKKTATQ
jgi:predicted  nucleic acid-binding Zn-ribbon protein